MEAKFLHQTSLHESMDSPNEIVPYIMEQLAPNSVLDVGCGLGAWLNVFHKNGVHEYLGLDGDWVERDRLAISEDNFFQLDLSQPFKLDKKFDLAISLEVAEHLPESSAKGFIESITQHSDLVLFSAAIPSQRGLNHLNEQPHQYWQKLFESFGFHLIDEIRWQFWDNPKVRYWYKQNMFVFSKNAKAGNGLQKSIIHPDLFYKRMKQLEEYEAYFQGKIPISTAFSIFLRSIYRKLIPHKN